MSARQTQGPSKSHLERLITTTSRSQGMTAARLRRWVSAMVLLGALQRDGLESPSFVLKGGVAVELRLGTGARTTQDVDVTFAGGQDLLEALDAALGKPYRDFGFRRGAATPHGPHATRFDVRLSYRSRAWSTVRLEVSTPGASAGATERLAAIRLDALKLSGPTDIACLPLDHQIAQKLHAVTERPPDRENARFRDLVDLLMLRELVEGLRSLRGTCEATFEHRATHAWPPTLDVPDGWDVGYAALASEVGLAITDVHVAAEQVRGFIAAIAGA